MATCFLFTRHFDEENCLSLRLDQQGQVDAPLERRTIDEVRALQINARTIVVLPTEMCSIHEVELPQLSERKARIAIPYALEEQVAQHVSSVHFAFDSQWYQNNRYLVVAIDKQYLIDLIAKLSAVDLTFDVVTLDWCALSAGEACLIETSLLIDDPTFKGAVSIELVDLYLNRRPSTAPPVILFNDSPPVQNMTTHQLVDCSLYVWVAQQLFKHSPLNLCQGELQHDTHQHANFRWYQLSAMLAGLWLVSLVGVNTINLYALTKQNTSLDQQIAVIYHEFFPQARQVISPKFRINQLLRNSTGIHDAVLWVLLNKLAIAANKPSLIVQQVRFQNQTLSVTLSSQDFAQLEAMQQQLQQQHVIVRQTEAATHEQRVVATLELSV